MWECGKPENCMLAVLFCMMICIFILKHGDVCHATHIFLTKNFCNHKSKAYGEKYCSLGFIIMTLVLLVLFHYYLCSE